MVETSSTRRVAVLVGAVLVTLAVTLGPALPATAAPDPSASEPGPTTYAGPGPFRVGERTLTMPTGQKMEVWYPARKADVKGKPIATYDLVDWLPDFLTVPPGTSVTYPSGGVRGVPVAPKTFPLVVFSHGYAGFRTQSSALTSAIASWGFVVAAPEHPSRNLTHVLLGPAGTTTDVQDLGAAISLVGKLNHARHGWLQGHVDMSRIAVLGHSAGGRAAEERAVVDKRIDTFIGMAGASVGARDSDGATKVPSKPGLLVAATDDRIVGLDKMKQAYADLKAPKRLVLIGGAGHLVFSDLCEVGASQGGLLAVAAAAGIIVPPALVPLATDGCIPPALSPTEAWPAIQQVVVAHLRHVFGIDRSGAGLRGLAAAYPGVIVGNKSEH